MSTTSAHESVSPTVFSGALAGIWGLCWAGCFALSSGQWGVLPAAGLLLVPWCIIGGGLVGPLPAARLQDLPRWVVVGGLLTTSGAWAGTYWASQLMLTSSFDLLHEIAALFATAVTALALWPWGLAMLRGGIGAASLGKATGAALLAIATLLAWVASTAIAPIVGFGLITALTAVASGALGALGLRCLLPARWLTTRLATGLVALCILTIVGGLVGFQTSPAIRDDARGASSFTHRMVVGLSSLLDGDGDGVASGLGFTDCNDIDPGVYPGATETAGNQRDDNCGGGDGDPAATRALWSAKGARGGAPTPSSFPSKRWNILVITLDAVRADHLSLYGYERATSPSLDNLGKLSVVFDAAWSASNFTSLSLFSLFTGLYPSHYLDGEKILARPGMTLPEQLRAHGYRTEAVVDLHPRLPHVFAGFDRIDDSLGVRAAKAVRNRSTGSTANELTVLAGASATRLAGTDTPFFLWVHYSEPHAAYLPHPQFDFGETEMDRYDGEIAFADHAVGRLLAQLHTEGRLKDTLIVVTSDHGEAFGEHGVETHGQSLYEEELRVPLLLYLPNDAGRGVATKRIPWPVDSTDITPTLLHAVGAEPRFPTHGESLLAPILDDHPLKTPQAFAETRLPYARLQALREGTTKTVINHLTGTAWQTDLSSDPDEQTPALTGVDAANHIQRFVDLHLARNPASPR